MKYVFVCMLCICFTSIISSQSRFIYSKVDVPIKENQSLKDLQDLGLSIICGSEHAHTHDQENIKLVLSDKDIRALQNQNIEYQIIEEDLSKKIGERNSSALPNARIELEELKLNQYKRGADVGQDLGCVEQEWPVPTNFKLGGMGGMLTYTELLAELDEMALKFPNLISIRASASASLTTIEGRDIQYVRISDNPSASETEPQVLYTALHHAREPMSMMNLVYYMWYILENYATDPDIKSLLDNTELLFIPCVNPDGYLYNESTDPNGGGYWRKNRRVNGGGTFGVDLNRNYGFQWGDVNGGSSGDPNSEVYRGTSAFSEPETQIIKEFVEARNIITAFNDHSAGNLQLYPWGYQSNVTPDEMLFHEMSEQMCWHNRYFYGPANTTIYAANGVADDWFYGEQTTKNKIINWTPEVGSNGFWPSPSQVVPQSQDQMRMNLLLAAMASNYGVLNDLTQSNFTSLNPTIDFSVQHLSNVPGSFTIQITPISPQILSITNSTLITSTINNDDFDFVNTSFNLDPATPARTKIVYEVTMSNGTYDIFTRRFTKQYTPGVIFSDSFDNGNNWTLGSWEIDASDGNTSNGSLTDSEGTLSEDGLILATSNAIDLSASQMSVLEYYIKWDIRWNYDYAQLQVSSDGTTWINPCGTYTKSGTPDGFYNTDQPAGEPLYDGIQSEWVREEFDLSNFDGISTVYLRLAHYGDSGQTHRDGIFIDDMSIYSTASPHCLDGILNFDETDIDCGGLDCVACPTCTDGIQNGSETEIDCGGPDCNACPICETVTLMITFDNFPNETSWDIVDANANSVASGTSYGSETPGSTITESVCLEAGCYNFTFYDSYGDGICCAEGNGSYSLQDGSGMVIASNGNFTNSETTNFCITIQPTGDCPYDLSVTTYPISDSTYYAENNISSDATIPNNHNIVLSAGNEIYINESFEVISGATFHALIGGCTQ